MRKSNSNSSSTSRTCTTHYRLQSRLHSGSHLTLCRAPEIETEPARPMCTPLTAWNQSTYTQTAAPRAQHITDGPLAVGVALDDKHVACV